MEPLTAAASGERPNDDARQPARQLEPAQVRTAETTLERHRTAVRARLTEAGAVRAQPGSVSWTINREIVLVAGWGRAILLQLAHPLIAAGVAEHSSFRGGPFSSVKRLGSTVGAMLSLMFGSDDEAIGAAARINSIHDHVSGQLGEPAGVHGAGQRYSAHDPALLRWVHVTLLDSTFLTYQRLVGDLTLEERNRYCAEAAIMEPLVGIPEGLLPRTSSQLDACLRETLGSGHVAVTATSRELARAILFPSGWRAVWPAFRLVQLLTIGLLPPGIRAAYGFEWTARDARALARWTAAMRLLHRVTPPQLRQWPAARRRTDTTIVHTMAFTPLSDGSSPQ
jgi:uncharacterized protein (DUF2236 family)